MMSARSRRGQVCPVDVRRHAFGYLEHLRQFLARTGRGQMPHQLVLRGHQQAGGLGESGVGRRVDPEVVRQRTERQAKVVQ
jgi:hypothetical protein